MIVKKTEQGGDMREYRGKRKDNGEWVYGYYVHVDDEDYIFTGKTGLSQVTPAHVLMYKDFVRYEVIPETVGRYTGLKDKNGVRIFEGDVVKDTAGNIGVVLFCHHFLRYQIRFYIGDKNLLEYGKYGVHIFYWIYPKMLLTVIGNIHDNPELLGETP